MGLREPTVVIAISHGVIQVQHEKRRGHWLSGGGEWRTGSGQLRQPEHRQDLSLQISTLVYSQATLGKDVRGTRAVAAAQSTQSHAQQPEETAARSHLRGLASRDTPTAGTGWRRGSPEFAAIAGSSAMTEHHALGR